MFLFVFSEEVPLAIIISGAVGGVVIIAVSVVAYIVYQRCRHSDNGKIIGILYTFRTGNSQNCFWLPSAKRSALKGKNLHPRGANSFLLD